MSAPPAMIVRMQTLTDRDREILAFEERWLSATSGAREGAILSELGMKPSRYVQLLNRIIDKPEALAASPLQVKRLQRERDRRDQMRTERRLTPR